MVASPLFSIITVTRNAAENLRPTLASVAGQSCRLFEHIIVDGASTDNTKAVVDCCGYPVRFLSEPDSGIYDAMNKGLAMARGEYVLFLNAGDRLHNPDTLQHIADAAMEADFPGIIYGQTDIVDAAGKKVGERHLRAPEQLTLESFAEGMMVCHQAFVALRRITVPYDLRYRYSADYLWCIHCLQHSRRNLYVDEVIADYLNEGETTRHWRKSLWERFRIMADHYGFYRAVVNHIGFVPRYLKRRRRRD